MHKFICPICNEKKQSKIAFERHKALCKILSVSTKERIPEIDTLPDIRDIFKIVVTICEENEKLTNRISELERNNFINKKKTIKEYLSLLKSDITFQEWLKTIIVTDEDFQYLIEHNLTECIKHILEKYISNDLIDKVPLKAFHQKNNEIYFFENNIWEILKTDELKYFITILTQRISRKYMDWRTVNSELIASNSTIQELDMNYMAKTIGYGQSIESRISEIRKYIFLKIKQDIRSIDI